MFKLLLLLVVVVVVVVFRELSSDEIQNDAGKCNTYTNYVAFLSL